MLTDASIEGKVDHLLGLKENVIIGKLIPAATGLKRYRQIGIGPPTPVPAHLYTRPETEAELLAGAGGDRRRRRRPRPGGPSAHVRRPPGADEAARTTPARRPRPPRSTRRSTRTRGFDGAGGYARSLRLLERRRGATRSPHLAGCGCVWRAPPTTHIACGLPETKPLWVDYGTPELIDRFGRPASSSPARAAPT